MTINWWNIFVTQSLLKIWIKFVMTAVKKMKADVQSVFEECALLLYLTHASLYLVSM